MKYVPVKDDNDNVFTIYVPSVSDIASLISSTAGTVIYSSVAVMSGTVGFSCDYTLFAFNDARQAEMQSVGFTHVYSARALVGSRWTIINNGSYITFTAVGSSQVIVGLYLSDGTLVHQETIVSSTAGNGTGVTFPIPVSLSEVLGTATADIWNDSITAGNMNAKDVFYGYYAYVRGQVMAQGFGSTSYPWRYGLPIRSTFKISEASYNKYVDFWYNAIPPEHTDPYHDNGATEPGGGGGGGYPSIIDDDIDFPTPLNITASNANFISIWTPTLEQIQVLAAWMWTTDPLKWEFWQKLIQNPLELIFSLSIMPVPIYHPDEGGTPTSEELIANQDTLSLGWQNTGIKMDWVPEQYVTVDMGTIEMEEIWGAFLDYEPYTKIDIFLPYIGTKQLDTNDCMPRTISLKYIIDLATGTCLALIKCNNSVYYHFSGNCASQIPLTVNQCQEIVRGLMTMAVGAATFGIGAVGGAIGGASAAATKAGGAAMLGQGANNAAKGVNVSRSGTIGAAAGLMDIQTPYLIISRPRQAVPEDQNMYTGYPSFITEQIGDLSGYTEVQMIHLHDMSCTDEEYAEIDQLLKEGVII